MSYHIFIEVDQNVKFCVLINNYQLNHMYLAGYAHCLASVYKINQQIPIAYF